MTEPRQIGVTFTPEHKELYDWVMAQSKKRPMPKAWFVIEALTAYRQLLTLSGGDWQDWLERASSDQTKLREAIRLFKSDDGFEQAMDILATLAGLPITNFGEGKTIEIFGIAKNEVTNE